MPEENGNSASRRAAAWTVIVSLLLVGIGARLALAPVGMRYGFFGDHFVDVIMGATAQEYGLVNIYNPEIEETAVIRGTEYRHGQPVKEYNAPSIQKVNYPPLIVSVFWLQTKLLRTLDPTFEANTVVARRVMSSASILAEILLAVVAYLIATELFGRRAGLIAAGVCWLFPPFAMDTAFWGQTDNLFMAPVMLAVWLMLKRQWILAGLVLAVVAGFKPQVLLIGPVVVFAACALPEPGCVMTGRIAALRALKACLTGCLGTALLTLPWIITSGLEWFRWTYLRNMTGLYGDTTLKAFNLWYLRLLVLDKRPIFGFLGTNRIWDWSGALLTFIVLALLAFACWRRYRRSPLGMVVFAGLWLWSCFIWPTRVHERYILYCIPFIIIAATGLRRLWPAVVGLLIVGVVSLTWTVWLERPAGFFNQDDITGWYGIMTEHHQKSLSALPPGATPPPAPTLQDAATVAWYRHRNGRAESEWLEYIVEAVSVASYAWALVVGLIAFRRPEPAVQEEPA